jgi:hypothetical protein
MGQRDSDELSMSVSNSVDQSPSWEMLIVAQLDKKFTAFYETRRFIGVFTAALYCKPF